MSAQIRLHFIVFLWGFTAILGKLITLSASHLVWWRMLLTSVCLLLFIVIFQKKNIFINKSLIIKLIGAGSVIAIHWLFFFESIKTSNVSIALSCLSTTTLFVALIEPLIFRRKIDWAEILLGIITLSCMLLIFKTETQYTQGIIYGIIGAAFSALFSVLNGKLQGSTTSGNIIFYEVFGGFLVISLYFLFTNELEGIFSISKSDFWWVFLLASLFTAYPMFESIRLMRYISPFTLILAVNLEPIYGILFAYFIFGVSEHMNPMFYIASCFMILAVIANGILKARKK